MSSKDTQSYQRFADVGQVFKRMLPPIEGYETKPVVSLEEAVEPLVDIVPRIQRNVYIVKENCHEPKDGLTSDESAAIMLYTLESKPSENSLYYIFNKTLRTENRTALAPWFLYLRLIMNGLEKLPSISTTVFRGVAKDLRADYQKGLKFFWWAFSSCTTKIEVLENSQFLSKAGNRTLFQIFTATGKDIKNHSMIEKEYEILLMPARQLVVEGTLTPAKGLTIIQLRETTPPFPLIEPIPKPSPTTATKKTSARLHNIPSNARWSTKGDVIIEGLSKWPEGLGIDQQSGTVFVADADRNRIVSWTPGEQGISEVVKNLNWPTNVLIDKDNNSVIIADRDNRRVIRYCLQSDNIQIETIIDNIYCRGLAIDDEGTLYVTDWQEHEVRRYPKGNKRGELVAGGNGKGEGLHQLNYPYYVTVDSEGAVYVSDHSNHRVVKWNRGATQGIVVAGFEGEGSKNTQLNYPLSVLIDANDNLYIADQSNHRVVRYRKNGTRADIIVDKLNYPKALAFDNANNLYVSDNRARVLRFNIIH